MSEEEDRIIKYIWNMWLWKNLLQNQKNYGSCSWREQQTAQTREHVGNDGK